jgi:hypothetical protein
MQAWAFAHVCNGGSWTASGVLHLCGGLPRSAATLLYDAHVFNVVFRSRPGWHNTCEPYIALTVASFADEVVASRMSVAGQFLVQLHTDPS